MSVSSDKPRRPPRTAQQNKRNIREAYIKAVKNNGGLTGLRKSRSFSNLANYNTNVTSSSGYLEDQYSLVKHILTATTALNKLNKAAKSSDSAPTSARSVTGKPQYKSQEEYYEEIIQLKKAVKRLEKNETVAKAKIEYYENELVKKNQEIENLLDAKLADETLKKEYKQLVSLKKKLFRVESQLKVKEAELQKLQSSLNTTNTKELQISNQKLFEEILRLNKCLTELQQKNSGASTVSLNGVKGKHGQSNMKFVPESKFREVEVDNEKLKNENNALKEEINRITRGRAAVMNEDKDTLRDKIEHLESENDKLKKTIQDKDNQIVKLKRDMDDLSDDGSKSRTSEFSLNEKLLDTDRRSISPKIRGSNEYLKRHSSSPKRPSSKQSSLRGSTDSLSRKTDRTKENAEAIDIITSVFKGHGERKKLIKENAKNEKNEKLFNDSIIERKKAASPIIERRKASSPMQSGRKSSKSPVQSRHNSVEKNKDTKLVKKLMDSDDDDLVMD